MNSSKENEPSASEWDFNRIFNTQTSCSEIIQLSWSKASLKCKQTEAIEGSGDYSHALRIRTDMRTPTLELTWVSWEISFLVSQSLVSFLSPSSHLDLRPIRFCRRFSPSRIQLKPIERKKDEKCFNFLVDLKRIIARERFQYQNANSGILLAFCVCSVRKAD